MSVMIVWAIAAVIIVLVGVRNDLMQKDYKKARALMCDYLKYPANTDLTVYQLAYEICYGIKENESEQQLDA